MSLIVGNSGYTMNVAPGGGALTTPVDYFGNLVTAGNYQTTSGTGVVVSGLSDGNAVAQRVDRLGNTGQLAVLPVLWEMFESATLNTHRWTAASTTFAPATAVTGYTFNPTTLTTANAVSVLLSNKRVVRTAKNPVQFKMRGRAANYANSVQQFGLCDTAATNAQIANGAYFHYTTAGALKGEIALSSSVAGQVDILSVTLPTDNGIPLAFVPDPAKTYVWDIVLDDDSVLFLVQDTSTGSIVGKGEYNVPLTAARMLAATHLSAFARMWNGAVAPATAPQLVVNWLFVGYYDAAVQSKPWADILATNHLHAVLNPSTVALTANAANSTAPTSATLSNTAAGYTTLGGHWQFAAVAGAATDYCLFGFQVPTGYTLVVKGITIDAWNTGAAVATTPTLLVWSVGANSTAVSLATAGMLRHQVGAQSFAIGAVIGAHADRQVTKNFNVPVVTEGGRFFCVILRMPVGTATASQVVQGMVHIDGYLE